MDEPFTALRGGVRILRCGQPFWSSVIHTVQEHMAHNLANLEYHHFKYDCHRVPFQAHRPTLDHVDSGQQNQRHVYNPSTQLLKTAAPASPLFSG